MPAFVMPDFGVEVIQGKPGAGKSLFAVYRMLRALERDKRPVYTNLPINWRPMRTYLRNKGGPELVNLVRPLTEEHLRVFMRRFIARAKFIESLRLAGKFKSYHEADLSFERQAGPAVEDGDGANWIPEGSMVIVDEAHWWFPAMAHGTESPDLLRYLSMHRHVGHWCWFLTQDMTRLSVAIRRMASCCWTLSDMGKKKFLWGFQFSMVGWSSISAKCFPVTVEGQIDEEGDPIDQRMLIPWLPDIAVLFRLYKSISHTGDLKTVQRAMARRRRLAGLSSA